MESGSSLFIFGGIDFQKQSSQEAFVIHLDLRLEGEGANVLLCTKLDNAPFTNLKLYSAVTVRGEILFVGNG